MKHVALAAVTTVALCGTASAQIILARDLCSSADADNVGPGIYIAIMADATTGVDGQAGLCGEVEEDIWFTYTATADGDARISTCFNENINTKLVAWPAMPLCPVDGTELTCSDDVCDERASIRFTVTAGTSYVIQLGKPDVASAITDPIIVVIDEIPPPANPPLGESYCGPGNFNTEGMRAEMFAYGSLNIADNNLNLEATGVPSGEFGYWLVSRTQDYFMPPNSLGNMCLGGDTGRYNFAILQDPFAYSPDLNNLPTNTAGSQQTMPGETLNFQLWYRDGSTYSGFTNALAITFQ